MFGRIQGAHDPFWDDGVGARSTHRRVVIEGFVALMLAIVACGLTAAVWVREITPYLAGGGLI